MKLHYNDWAIPVVPSHSLNMLIIAYTCLISASAKKVATITVKELFNMSTVIVTAQVESVSVVNGVKVANAKILVAYKGHPNREVVSFVAEKTWTCDTSDAKKGEKVLLYLSDPNFKSGFEGGKQANLAAKTFEKKGTTLYSISASGRGRIPLVPIRDSYQIPVHLETSYMGPNQWHVYPELVLPNGKLVKKKPKANGVISLHDLLSYR